MDDILSLDCMILIGEKIGQKDLIHFSKAVSTPEVIRYKPRNNKDYEEIIEACFQDFDVFIFAMKYGILPKDVDVCFYAVKYGNLDILKWARCPNVIIDKFQPDIIERASKPSIPVMGKKRINIKRHNNRVGPPKPWDFKSYALSDTLKSAKISEYLGRTHYYGKCPTKICSTTVNNEYLLTIRGSYSYSPIHGTNMVKIKNKYALNAIMKRRGIRMIDQCKPRKDEIPPGGYNMMEEPPYPPHLEELPHLIAGPNNENMRIRKRIIHPKTPRQEYTRYPDRKMNKKYHRRIIPSNY
jgi:hypothetical protein